VSDLQALADRVEIEALRGELTDAVMMRDYDRLASLFTPDGVVRVPHINAEAVGREQLPRLAAPAEPPGPQAGYRSGSDRGSPNQGSTLLSKRVRAQIRSPVSVRT
jgi:hypothetical protein